MSKWWIFMKFSNLEELTKRFVKNVNLDTNNEKINWLLIKCMEFWKSDPPVRFKYNCDYEFWEMNVIRTNCRNKFINHPRLNASYKLAQKYYGKLYTKQYKDLMALLKSGVIPGSYNVSTQAWSIPLIRKMRFLMLWKKNALWKSSFYFLIL